MAYSGRYKVKNRSKYKGDPDNVVYRSHWEKLCFKWCDDSSDIIKWCSEEIVIPYFYDVDKRYHRYFVDLFIETKKGDKLLIEIKPDKETKPPKNPNRSKRYIKEATTFVKNQNKWEAATKFAKDNGYIFQVWTENTLKQLGIMKSLTRKKTVKKSR